jgi:hypothetical protein
MGGSRSTVAVATFVRPVIGGIQFLRHEIMPVSNGVIFKRPKCPVPELFVKWSRLKTEGVKECIGTSALNRIGLQFVLCLQRCD